MQTFLPKRKWALSPKAKKTKGKAKSPPVQCYRLLEPEDYCPGEKGAVFIRQKWLQNRLTKSVRTFDSSGSGTEQNIPFIPENNPAQHQHAELPRLKVSDNLDLALEEPNLSYVFYASEQKIEDSNRILENSKSRIRLARQEQSIILHYFLSSPELWMVKILYNGKPAEEIGNSSECIFFMHDILSIPQKQNLVAHFRFPDGTELEENFHSRESADSLATRVFAAMGQEEFLSPSTTAYHFPQDEVSLSFKKAKKIKKGFEALPQAVAYRQAEHLGINRYANPKIGEGFSIYSGNAVEKAFYSKYAPSNNFEELFKETMAMGTLKNRSETIYYPWQFQFAGVIAKSDYDFITLENVHQQSEMMSKLAVSFYRLYKSIPILRELVNELSTQNPYFRIDKSNTSVFEYLERLIPFLLRSDRIGPAIKNELVPLWKQKTHFFQIPENRLFFLNMYGNKPGQSFHEYYEHQIASPAVTVVVKDSLRKWKDSAALRLEQVEKDLLELYKIGDFIQYQGTPIDQIFSAELDELSATIRPRLATENYPAQIREWTECFEASAFMMLRKQFGLLYFLLAQDHPRYFHETFDLGNSDLDYLQSKILHFVHGQWHPERAHELERLSEFTEKMSKLAEKYRRVCSS